MQRNRRRGARQLVKLEIEDLPRWEWEAMVAWRSGKRPDAAKLRVLQAVREVELMQ